MGTSDVLKVLKIARAVYVGECNFKTRPQSPRAFWTADERPGVEATPFSQKTWVPGLLRMLEFKRKQKGENSKQ